MNNFNPWLSVALCCNNDIKLLTNGADTKDTMWYSTMYQSKKQGRNYNVSALMAEAHDEMCNSRKLYSHWTGADRQE